MHEQMHRLTDAAAFECCHRFGSHGVAPPATKVSVVWKAMCWESGQCCAAEWAAVACASSFTFIAPKCREQTQGVQSV